MAQLGRIYRQILRPRIEAEGPAVSWPLRGQAWYDSALRLSSALARDPLDLLLQAERCRSEAPRLTAKGWVRMLGLDPPSRSALIDDVPQALAVDPMQRGDLRLLARIDPDGAFTHVDPRLGHLLGRSPAEVAALGSGGVMADPEGHRHLLRALGTSRRSSEAAFDFPAQFRHADGSVVEVRLVIALEYSARSERLVRIRWYELGAPLRGHARRRFVGKDGHVQYVSPGAAELLGAAPSELEGTALRDLTGCSPDEDESREGRVALRLRGPHGGWARETFEPMTLATASGETLGMVLVAVGDAAGFTSSPKDSRRGVCRIQSMSN